MARLPLVGAVPLLLVAIGASLAAAAQAPAARARQLYARAVQLEQAWNPGAALPLLWEAAGLAPDDGVVQDRLGQALERIGALDAAVDAYQRAAAARPPAQGAGNHLVLALVKAGRARDAIARARDAAADSPRDPDRWFTLGLAQSDADTEGAIESFNHALAIDPRHVLARYNLALVLYHADRLGPALDQLRQALAIEQRPEIHYTIGVIRWHQGDLAGAVDALSAAIAVNPSYTDAHLALGTVLAARGDLKRAAASLKRAIALAPDLAAPHVVLARTLTLAGDAAGAARETAESDRLRERAQRAQAAATLTAAGTEKLDAGNVAAAADCFRRATQALDTFAAAHYQLGRALDQLGDRAGARAAFARARQLNPALVPPR